MCKGFIRRQSKAFFEIGAWKTRLSGRELKFSEEERFQFQEKSGKLIFEVKNLNNDWKQWYKTMGDMVQDDQGYLLEYKKYGVAVCCKRARRMHSS